MVSGDRCLLKHPINATYRATEALGGAAGRAGTGTGKRRSCFFRVGGANSPSCILV